LAEKSDIFLYDWHDLEVTTAQIGVIEGGICANPAPQSRYRSNCGYYNLVLPVGAKDDNNTNILAKKVSRVLREKLRHIAP
jgi:hypothetical protein